MKTYEGMFLMDPALASDWASAEAEINRFLSRAEAKVHGIRNWDERRLAYPIMKQKRGLYALTFFDASPEKITALERDVQLSEKCLRALILNRESMTAEDIAKALAAEAPKLVSRYDERPGGRPDRGPRGDDRGEPSVDELDVPSIDAIDDA